MIKTKKAESIEVPKDLGLKVGSKEQILWEQVAKESRVGIEKSEQNLIVQKAFLNLALEKIAEEKSKMVEAEKLS